VRRGYLVVKSLAAGDTLEPARCGGGVLRHVGDLLDKPRRPDYLSSTLAQRVPNIKFRSARRSEMGFRPLHDRVLVRRVEAEEKTAGGIIIPDTAKEKPMEGEIVSVGPGARGEDGKIQPLDVKAGDRVLFGKWSGTEVKLDGEDLIIMKESDIMGIMDASAARKAA
jgi:chaperonin GroES